MKTVLVVGAKGKMGKAICKSFSGEFEVIECDKGDDLEVGKSADLVIDFATHETSVCLAKFCVKNKIPLIVGSTGQTKRELKKIEEAAKVVPVVLAGNFSVGIFLLKKALDVFENLDDKDVTVFEKHHSAKKDSPSGTALELEKVLKQKTKKQISVLSERGGQEIGTHEVDIYFGDEVLKFSHQAFSRQAFVNGVKISAKFLLTEQVPKLYHFEDVLKNCKI